MSFIWLWLGVGVLGGLGAIARFLLDALVSTNAGGGFPLGTLLVNLTGAFVLGLLAGLALGEDAYLLSGTAVIGSYTTFSTWMLESHRLAEDRRRRLLGANVVLSLALGVGAAALGRALGGG
ncbi:MAG TPA: fluoride efflux transporter CrcB [Solirubrobacteraceae bacterium]|nr:fluoride efflux transporter CrcB [Solirubrobacteraceae bacterium]